MQKQQIKVETPIGPLYLVASDSDLYGIYFARQKAPMTDQLNPILKQAQAQLAEYFAGTRQAFDLPLKMEGTKFQSQVWQELKKIPYGKTISYGELARRIKNPKAVRAVGSANGRNPVAIVVPCHRVIASDGTLGGYGGGLPRKTKLLDLENAWYGPNAKTKK